jgi:uncharacterized membrane protein YfcA
MLEALGWISALVMGLTLGLMGGGGAILTVPILVYLFKHPAQQATTESLLIVGSISLYGLWSYISRKLVDFRMAFTFALPALVGVVGARRGLLPLLPDRVNVPGLNFTLEKDAIILSAFAAVMLLAARAMLHKENPTRQEGAQHTPSFIHVGLQGITVGLVTGFVGAGGGFLIVPALVKLLKVPMEKAVGTSLFIITLNSFFGFISGLTPETISPLSWKFLIPFGLISAAGISIGTYWNSKVSPAKLKRAFGVLVLVMGCGVLAAQIFGS